MISASTFRPQFASPRMGQASEPGNAATSSAQEVADGFSSTVQVPSFLDTVIGHIDNRNRGGVDMSAPYRGVDLLADFEKRSERVGDGSIRNGLKDINADRNLNLTWEEHLMPLQREGFLMSTYYPDGATPCTLTTRAGDLALKDARASQTSEIDGWLIS